MKTLRADDTKWQNEVKGNSDKCILIHLILTIRQRPTSVAVVSLALIGRGQGAGPVADWRSTRYQALQTFVQAEVAWIVAVTKTWNSEWFWSVKHWKDLEAVADELFTKGLATPGRINLVSLIFLKFWLFSFAKTSLIFVSPARKGWVYHLVLCLIGWPWPWSSSGVCKTLEGTLALMGRSNGGLMVANEIVRDWCGRYDVYPWKWNKVAKGVVLPFLRLTLEKMFWVFLQELANPKRFRAFVAEAGIVFWDGFCFKNHTL